MGREDRRGDERGHVVRTGRSLLEPATRRGEPRPVQPRFGLRRSREDPRREADELRGEIPRDRLERWRSSTSWHHTCARSRSLVRASVTMSGDASRASTLPRGTSARSASVTLPVPQPTSRTVASGEMPSSRASTSEAHACWGSLERSYVPASQGVPIGALRLSPRIGSPSSAPRDSQPRSGAEDDPIFPL